MSDDLETGRRSSERKNAFCPSLPDDPTHPVQVALRTYALSLSLSLGPSLLPFLSAQLSSSPRQSAKYGRRALLRVLMRELRPDGFAFAMTFAVGGGVALSRLWNACSPQGQPRNEADMLPANWYQFLRARIRHLLQTLSTRFKWHPTFFSSILTSFVAILLIQAGRKRHKRHRNIPAPVSTIPLTYPSSYQSIPLKASSPTLDLTILLLVRAVDALCQITVYQRTEHKKLYADHNELYAEPDFVRLSLLREQEQRKSKRKRQTMTTRIDALIFWLCSARIMWCFFYQPDRLPRSYVKWISTLANVDQRLTFALRALKSGTWSYICGSPIHKQVLMSYARDLGYPMVWGDPAALPAYGSRSREVWKALGKSNRIGVGGLPCELVHGGIVRRFGLDASCTANCLVRGFYAFMEAIAIYIPAHFLPILLTRPNTLLRSHHFMETLLGSLRSAGFLSAFVASYWATVCFTRTVALARLFPCISHDFWDGPYGCILAGCLACGSSIWIENGRRRGEMALYVLPRAIRTCLPDSWIQKGNRALFRWFERLAFVLSFASLLTAALHRPDSLRGLSRWTLAFILKGPNTGFWKRKQRSPSAPMTPSIPPTPCEPSTSQEQVLK